MKPKRTDVKRELERLIVKAHISFMRMKEQRDQFDQEKRSISNDISRWMDELGETEYAFEVDESTSEFFSGGPETLSCKKVEPKSVKYNAEAICRKMGKKNAKAVVSKSYTVNDMNGLIELLKGYGVDPKKFKRFISVSYSVDEKKLEQLYELGMISKSDLEGCYTVERKTPYWSIRSIKNDK